VINSWHPTHHILLRESPQAPEVEMSEARVPPPSWAIPLRSKTHGSRHVELQFVQTVHRARYACQQPTLCVPNLETPIQQQYLVASFLQLPKAHDVGGESWAEFFFSADICRKFRYIAFISGARFFSMSAKYFSIFARMLRSRKFGRAGPYRRAPAQQEP
jgi:hypothetical protein